jgi:hypothetical protein
MRSPVSLFTVSRGMNQGSSNEVGNTGVTVSSKHWAIVQGWIPATGDEAVSLLNVSGGEVWRVQVLE